MVPMVTDDILRAMAVRSERRELVGCRLRCSHVVVVLANTNVPVADVEEPTNLVWGGKLPHLVQFKLLSCAGSCPLCLIPKLLCSGLREALSPQRLSSAIDCLWGGWVAGDFRW